LLCGQLRFVNLAGSLCQVRCSPGTIKNKIKIQCSFFLNVRVNQVTNTKRKKEKKKKKEKSLKKEGT